MREFSQVLGIAVLTCVTAVATRTVATAAEAKVPKSATDETLIYENWPEEVPNGQIIVAMDGSVLIRQLVCLIQLGGPQDKFRFQPF